MNIAFSFLAESTESLGFWEKLKNGWNTHWTNVIKELPKAGVNTVLGIAIVFVALIFISFVISRFKYISIFEAWLKKRKDKKKENEEIPQKAIENTVAQIEQAEELSGDEELVAVITAAIYAYESEQGSCVDNGIVVRSIRKAKKNGWQRA